MSDSRWFLVHGTITWKSYCTRLFALGGGLCIQRPSECGIQRVTLFQWQNRTADSIGWTCVAIQLNFVKEFHEQLKRNIIVCTIIGISTVVIVRVIIIIAVSSLLMIAISRCVQGGRLRPVCRLPEGDRSGLMQQSESCPWGTWSGIIAGLERFVCRVFIVRGSGLLQWNLLHIWGGWRHWLFVLMYSLVAVVTVQH